MKLKEKLKYISNRVLVMGILTFVMLLIFSVIQFVLAVRGKVPVCLRC